MNAEEHKSLHMEVTEFPKESPLKKVLVTEMDFPIEKLKLHPGDYASHIELKDGRKFVVLSHADGRVFRISEDAVEGGVQGEHVYEPGSDIFEKVLEGLHDHLLTTDLPEELGVPLAMKIPE